MYRIERTEGGFRLYAGNLPVMTHSPEAPALFLGVGKADIRMFRGNFDIQDRVEERLALRLAGIDEGDSETVLTFAHPDVSGGLRLRIAEREGRITLRTETEDTRCNRIWIRLPAEEKEHVMGGGEQFSALDLRGRIYPIWTREQGVGRNKLTEVTRLADSMDGGGGDYHTTFFPQPTFVSSRMYFAHLHNYDYAELDFRSGTFHEIAVWSPRISLTIAAGDSYAELLEKLTALLGRQPALPGWAMEGVWLGVQGGTERVTDIVKKCRAGGMDVSAVWIQDWEGKRVTSFGKRLQWDWRWNPELYPGLDEAIASDPETRWMGYINPYLVEGGLLFEEAREKAYLVRKADGSDYLFDFGEFDCGVVDLTMPAAYEWYKNVIKQNLIGMGFRGWMADFGEYLPADAVCANGETGMTAHNRWPVLWAKCNREALAESGLLGDCLFYMRAGGAGSQRHSTLTWAGDQCVDWSEDDGLPSVITAALSLGMSGFGLHTSDAGGYTTLFHLRRDAELLLRWLEFACFTPVMRTHEGNRPESNVQIYSDENVIRAAARLTRLHTALRPYMEHCVRENAERGLPVMRPLFFEAPEEEIAYDRGLYSYLLGSDVLVAPVVQPGANERELWLPDGEWIHLWSGKPCRGGRIGVPAPMGMPPVFYKAAGAFAPLFAELGREYAL